MTRLHCPRFAAGPAERFTRLQKAMSVDNVWNFQQKFFLQKDYLNLFGRHYRKYSTVWTIIITKVIDDLDLQQEAGRKLNNDRTAASSSNVRHQGQMTPLDLSCIVQYLHSKPKIVSSAIFVLILFRIYQADLGRTFLKSFDIQTIILWIILSDFVVWKSSLPIYYYVFVKIV